MSYDLIDRNALLDKSYSTCRATWNDPYAKDGEEVVSVLDIENAPTIEAKPVNHAYWKRTANGAIWCSSCNSFIGMAFSDTGFEEAIRDLNYCSVCGAQMDGKKPNEVTNT